MPCLLLGRNLAKNGLAAPFLGNEIVFRQGLLDLARIRVGLVDLVDGHDNRDARHAGMVDGLYGLPHDAVIGRHDQHDDIRHLGASGAHGRKGLMARRIEKDDVPVFDMDMIGADGLGDPAGLTVDHVCLPDRIEKRRLAVIDVAHDRHDRRSWLEVLRGGFDFREWSPRIRPGPIPPDTRIRRR